MTFQKILGWFFVVSSSLLLIKFTLDPEVEKVDNTPAKILFFLILFIFFLGGIMFITDKPDERR